MKTIAFIFKNHTEKFNMLLCTFLMLIVSIASQAQDKEFVIKYPNGLVYQEGKLITNIYCGPAIQVTTYDLKGKVIKREDWVQGVRCGATKVYDNGELIKDIVFKKNLMESYISYIDGKVNCQISADRNKIVHNGKLVDIKWSRFYHVIDDKKFMYFDKKSFIDIFRVVMVPEDMTKALVDISALYNGKDVPGKSAVVGGCGNNASVINDQAANFKSTDAAGQKKSADAGATVLNACSASRNAELTAPFDGKTGNAARAGRIAKAKSAMDKMIANCSTNGSNLSSGGLMAVGEATVVNFVYDLAVSGEAVVEVVESAEAIEATAAGFESAGGAGLHSSLPVRIAKAAETTMKVLRPIAAGAADATAGAAGTTASAGATAGTAATGTVATGTATTGTVATGTAATGTTAGAGIVTTMAAGALIIVGAVAVAATVYHGFQSFIAYKDAQVTDAVGAQADEELAKLRASEKAKETASRDAKNANPPPKRGGGPTTPMPPGMGSENGCERLKRFKQYCDDNNWNTSDCEEAARLFSGCAGDITVMYVSGDGNVSDVGCPQSMSPEDLAKKECERRGGVAMPLPGGSLCRAKGAVQGFNPPMADPNVINPTRGDFSNVFKNTSVRVMASGVDLSANLKSATKKTMVVFMDPDCPSCKTMSNSLKSPEVQAATGNVNILVVDASLATDVFKDYKISAFPSTMIINNGKVSPMTIGSMSPKETVTFINAD